MYADVHAVDADIRDHTRRRHGQAADAGGAVELAVRCIDPAYIFYVSRLIDVVAHEGEFLVGTEGEICLVDVCYRLLGLYGEQGTAIQDAMRITRKLVSAGLELDAFYDKVRDRCANDDPAENDGNSRNLLGSHIQPVS